MHSGANSSRSVAIGPSNRQTSEIVPNGHAVKSTSNVP